MELQSAPASFVVGCIMEAGDISAHLTLTAMRQRANNVREEDESTTERAHRLLANARLRWPPHTYALFLQQSAQHGWHAASQPVLICSTLWTRRLTGSISYLVENNNDFGMSIERGQILAESLDDHFGGVARSPIGSFCLSHTAPMSSRLASWIQLA